MAMFSRQDKLAVQRLVREITSYAQKFDEEKFDHFFNALCDYVSVWQRVNFYNGQKCLTRYKIERLRVDDAVYFIEDEDTTCSKAFIVTENNKDLIKFETEDGEEAAEVAKNGYDGKIWIEENGLCHDLLGGGDFRIVNDADVIFPKKYNNYYPIGNQIPYSDYSKTDYSYIK